MSIEAKIDAIAQSLNGHKEDFSRWAGGVDVRLDTFEERISAVNWKINKVHDDKVTDLKEQVENRSIPIKDWLAIIVSVVAILIAWKP